ncbi:MAG: prepilin-type N-terminal cleavage/methylation domain-containing protein [Alphaproteobacteria bacterium]|nr:prepilin-type N-terminal cleavage/methylation domain-containing protein [Alphaproteobacteria bacterium]
MTRAAVARPTSHEAGFTLVELLVAMTLLGFVSILLFGGLRLGTRVWERTETGFQGDRALHGVEEAIADAVGHAYPRLIHRSATTSEIAFSGSPSSIALTAQTGDAGVAEVVITADQGAGSLTVASRSEISGATAATTTVFAGVASATFSYFGTTAGDNEPRWHDTWQSQRALPRLVRIVVRMRDGRQTPLDLTIAPRIQAPMDCVFDVLTDNCQGHG